MEDNELKEKILCAIKNNIDSFKKERRGGCGYSEWLQLNGEGLEIRLYKASKYKTQSSTKTNIIKSAWWRAERKEIIEVDEEIFDYNYGRIYLNGNYVFDTTKEEYEEIIKLRGEKIREKQLEELNKLCNNEQ